MRLDFGHAESGPEDSTILQVRFHHRGYGNGVRGARCSSRLRTAPVVSTDAILLAEACGSSSDALTCTQAVMNASPMRTARARGAASSPAFSALKRTLRRSGHVLE